MADQHTLDRGLLVDADDLDQYPWNVLLEALDLLDSPVTSRESPTHQSIHGLVTQPPRVRPSYQPKHAARRAFGHASSISPVMQEVIVQRMRQERPTVFTRLSLELAPRPGDSLNQHMPLTNATGIPLGVGGPSGNFIERTVDKCVIRVLTFTVVILPCVVMALEHLRNAFTWQRFTIILVAVVSGFAALCGAVLLERDVGVNSELDPPG